MVAPSKSLRDLFDTIVDLPIDQRNAFIEQYCKDAQTRQQLEELLLHDTLNTADSFVSPVLHLVPQNRTAEPAAGFISEIVDLGMIGQVLDNRYRIVEVVGQGGVGIVFRAEQIAPVKRGVAVKVLKPGMDTARIIARFESERQALARMNHPGIARVLDAGATPSGRLYVVMELIPGVQIAKYCDRQSLDIRDRVQLMLKVCEAMQHAHERGIIHRDLKPANILVADSGQPVIIDFGVAKAVGDMLADTQHTQQGQLIGTPEYMSPEQANLFASSADARTDVYGLGVILYELLTGNTPFDNEVLRSGGMAEMQHVIQNVEPKRMSTRVGSDDPARTTQLRGDLDWIVERAMQKQREHRYQSVQELANDLSRYLRNEPVLARPLSMRYRTGRFVRRHRVLVYGTSALILTLVTGATTSTVLAFREWHQRTLAQDNAVAAKLEASRAAAVNLFLRRMLETAGNLGSDGLNVTMGEVLEATSQRLDRGELADQPDVEIEVRFIVAKTYLELGWPTRGAQHAQWVLDHVEDQFGLNSERTIEMFWVCGEVLKGSSNYTEALAAFQTLHEVLLQEAGPDDSRTWTALNQVGNTLFRQGNVREAGQVHEEALKQTQRLLGNDHIETALAAANLGGVMRRIDEWERAEELYLQALSVIDRVGDPASSCALRREMAVYVLPFLGRDADADRYMREAVDIALTQLGEHHGGTFGTLEYAAFHSIRLGHREEALSYLRQAVELVKQSIGTGSYEHAEKQTSLAWLYLLSGDSQAAVVSARDVLSILDSAEIRNAETSMSIASRNDRVRARAMYVLCHALHNTRSFDNAIAACHELIAIAEQQPKALTSFRIEATRIMLACELALGQTKDIEPQIRTLLAETETVYGTDRHITARVRFTLADCLETLELPGGAAERKAAIAVLEKAAHLHYRPFAPLQR